jgi:hypothetical protein
LSLFPYVRKNRVGIARECKTEYGVMKNQMRVYKRLDELRIVPQGTILKALGNGMLTYTHLRDCAAIESDWRMRLS